MILSHHPILLWYRLYLHSRKYNIQVQLWGRRKRGRRSRSHSRTQKGLKRII